MLGDRSVLLKYINPAGRIVVDIDEENELASLAVTDSNSGTVLHRMEINGVSAQSDLRIVFRDNWIICTFIPASDLAGFSTIVSIELFENSKGSE